MKDTDNQTASRLKKLIKKQTIMIPLIAAVFSLIYTLFSSGPFLLRIINCTFYIGLIYLALGMATYIHNIGLFKTFRYWGYKLRSGAYGKRYNEVQTMSFVDFSILITSEAYQKSGKYFYIYGAGFLALSYLLVYLMGLWQ